MGIFWWNRMRLNGNDISKNSALFKRAGRDEAKIQSRSCLCQLHSNPIVTWIGLAGPHCKYSRSLRKDREPRPPSSSPRGPWSGWGRRKTRTRPRSIPTVKCRPQRWPNRQARIRHQCRKTTVLSCHRCLINTVVEKWTTFNYRLELWPRDVSK